MSLSLADGNGRTAAVHQCIHTTATPAGPQTEVSAHCHPFMMYKRPGLTHVHVCKGFCWCPH